MIFMLSLYLTQNRESALLSCFIICCFEPLCFLVHSFMKVHPLEDFWLDPWHNHSCKHHWYHRNCCMCAFVSYQSWLDLGVEIFPGQDLPTYQVVLQYKLQEAAVLYSLFWTSYWKINIRKGKKELLLFALNFIKLLNCLIGGVLPIYFYLWNM